MYIYIYIYIYEYFFIIQYKRLNICIDGFDNIYACVNLCYVHECVVCIMITIMIIYMIVNAA